jgi:hypothetical protein
MPEPAVAEASASGAEALCRAVLASGARRVAFVGASKNAGKTTALNAVARDLTRRGLGYGLVSMGVDGEARDAWLGLPKPRLAVERGSLLVTGERIAAAAGRLLVVRERLGSHSSFGVNVLAEARGPGRVMLAGIRHRGDLAEAVVALEGAGAKYVLVDGAYHRQAAAHPAVADATVLSVGAALGEDAATAVAEALPTLAALLTPALTDPAGPGLIPVRGALADAWLAEASPPAGSVLVVDDPSRVLLSARGWLRLRRLGLAVRSRSRLPLVAVTASPHRPGGPDLPCGAVDAALRRALADLGVPDLPLVDVVAGARALPGPANLGDQGGANEQT